MAIDGYTTKIDPSKTAAEITKLLAKHKVNSINTTYSERGELSGMTFVIQTQFGSREFALPIRAEGVLATLKRDRVENRFLSLLHARNVAWRIALKWLQAQIALIDADMASLEEVFFPYMVGGVDSDRKPITMYKAYSDRQKAVEG